MLDNLMGNLNQQSEQMNETLRSIEILTEVNDHAIAIQGNASGVIKNIELNPSKLDLENKEELEDLLLVACNRFNEQVRAIQEAQSKEMIQQLLPPGMDNLFG